MSSQLSEEAIAKISVELPLTQALAALDALGGRSAAVAKTYVETALLWVQHKLLVELADDADNRNRRRRYELLGWEKDE